MFDPVLTNVLRWAHTRGSDPQDLRQQLDIRLFVAEGGAAPRIAEYRGVGSLRTWLRVVATRLLLNTGRRKTDRPEALTSRMEEALGDAQDVELEWLKERYRTAFRASLARALSDLPPSDRTLLRLCVVNGLSATGVAELYRVHRATAKRWLARIRGDVLAATREHLRATLHIESEELDSILGMIGSRLEASVRRCLADGADDAR
jgi:RNA polymerase sigma-70 factor (ECF subfamily)